jgi:peptide deformylase
MDNLLIYGEDALLSESTQVLSEDRASIPDLVSRLWKVVYEYGGFGLSAIQIGVPKRVAVVDISLGEDPNQRYVLINPTVPSGTGRYVCKEGCLSVPGFSEFVERPKDIDVVFEDEKFVIRCIQAKGMLARVIQHEIDHMNGVLFLDHISSLKREIIRNKIKKIRQNQ